MDACDADFLWEETWAPQQKMTTRETNSEEFSEQSILLFSGGVMKTGTRHVATSSQKGINFASTCMDKLVCTV